MPTGNDPTRIYKTPITPLTSHKLGASATWSKVKYQSTKIRNQDSITTKPHVDKIIEFGYNGEIFIGYGSTIEVWDWCPNVLELNESDKKNGNDAFDNETLYLVASLSNIKGVIIGINPIKCDQLTNTYKILITSQVGSETIFTLKTFGQVFNGFASLEKSLILPPFVHGLSPFTIKNSSTFIGIATNEGSLTIFDQAGKHPLSLSLEAAIINDQVMFSISGRYLAYVPNLKLIDEELQKTLLILPDDDYSIYSKILNNLSITAIDGMFKLSDLNSLKANLMHIKSNSLKANLKLYLSNLINGFKKNQYIIIYDLVKEEKIGCFQPPNGCSNLSLSPFNSQLITISQRGDQLYNWDLAKLPREISLIDFQIRGKTASIVDEISWYQQNSIQIITRSSGSIHSFKTGQDDKNWILSNVKCTKLSSNNNTILAYTNDYVYSIDPVTGSSSFNFRLPKSNIPRSLLPSHIPSSPSQELIIRNTQAHHSDDSPLSKIEIETCNWTTPLYTNPKLQLGTYDFTGDALDSCNHQPHIEQGENDSESEIFKKVYVVPGNKIGVKVIGGKGVPIFNDFDGLNEAINGVLVE